MADFLFDLDRPHFPTAFVLVRTEDPKGVAGMSAYDRFDVLCIHELINKYGRFLVRTAESRASPPPRRLRRTGNPPRTRPPVTARRVRTPLHLRQLRRLPQ